MPYYDLYSCPLHLDVQLLESNFNHFNWHHMLHSFYRVVSVVMGILFILPVCIMYKFSVALALICVPILIQSVKILL